MKNSDVLSTLFVGIDVSKKTNVFCAMNFEQDILLQASVPNDHPSALVIAEQLRSVLEWHKFKAITVALESTSFYGMHIANYLSYADCLLPFKPLVYCLNPKMIANYRKSFICMNKTDPLDAFIIADFARVGRINTSPWRGSQHLALQRLTRHRLHLIECITSEKTYMPNNIFLKFSQLAVLKEEAHPFSSN